MKIFGIICPVCGCTVYSRAHHDFIRCPCESVWIDGGQEGHCVRVGSNCGLWPETKHLELDVDLRTLYDDWNRSKNKYGIIYPDDYEIGLKLLHKWANEDTKSR